MADDPMDPPPDSIPGPEAPLRPERLAKRNHRLNHDITTAKATPMTPSAELGFVSKALVPLAVAIVAIVPPLTTAIYGYFHNAGELALAEKQYAHDVNAFYFKLAVAPDSGPELRESVLRYLADPANPNTRMQRWAKQELERVRSVLQEIRQLEEKLESAEAERDKLLEKLAEETTESENGDRLLALQEKIGHLQRETKSLRWPHLGESIPSSSTCEALKGPHELAGWELGDTETLRGCIERCLSAEGCVAVRWRGEVHSVRKREE